MDGSGLRGEPSTLEVDIMDGSGLKSEPSPPEVPILDGSIYHDRTFQDGGAFHARLNTNKLQPRSEAPYT